VQVIQAILGGKDALVLMATGSGKSLCYQLPSVALREMRGYRCVTLVVSPLISLMEDQVSAPGPAPGAQTLCTYLYL
jgi:superfamily II DNA helicase RecQ